MDEGWAVVNPRDEPVVELYGLPDVGVMPLGYSTSTVTARPVPPPVLGEGGTRGPGACGVIFASSVVGSMQRRPEKLRTPRLRWPGPGSRGVQRDTEKRVDHSD